MRERAVLERILPFELIEEIVGKLRSPKNSQLRPLAAPARRSCTKAERRDAGAGTDHDEVAVGGRQCKMLVGLESYAEPAALLEPLGHVIGGDTLACAPMAVVTHRRDQEVRLLAHLAAR
jgi:hypothetical protein